VQWEGRRVGGESVVVYGTTLPTNFSWDLITSVHVTNLPAICKKRYLLFNRKLSSVNYTVLCTAILFGD
jgi:hypothetical protein